MLEGNHYAVEIDNRICNSYRVIFGRTKWGLYIKENHGIYAISPNYVLKILRVLAKASLVQNHIGVYGGFSLCKHPRDITLLDIVSSTESTIKISYCLEQNTEESKEGYQTVRSMYNFYHDLQDEIEERLSHKTLEQLLSES